MSDDTNEKVLWFIAGAAIGSAVALLFAPQSGEQTRRLIGEQAEKGRDKLAESGRDLLERGRDLYGKGRQVAEEAAELFDQGRKLVDKTKS
ncbi:MAG: YtxH domain-containing protein [Acidobacteria bacterium]|nr:YtxH domain-containing protein [Acidobacteriota bacterium]MBI3282245.1 YtxH domain-containing protein [Acidobacteriota bacterium]